MRPYRRNADERLRELERLAAQGDRDAQAAVVRELLRTGQSTLQWLAGAGPEAFRLLPDDLQLAVLRATMFGAKREKNRPGVDLDLERMGAWGKLEDWFPEHTSASECPRGHSSPDGHTFELETLVSNFYTGVTTSGHEARASTDKKDEESESWVMLCKVCNARWPVDPSLVRWEWE